MATQKKLKWLKACLSVYRISQQPIKIRLALSKSANIKAQILDAKSFKSAKEEVPLIANYVKKLSIENNNCCFKYVNIVKEYALTSANSRGGALSEVHRVYVVLMSHD